MLSHEAVRELQLSWLPNITDAGLIRIIDLLEKSSPFLTHGCFTRAVPIGCLATHAGWNHPRTAHLNHDAGINWLHHIAGLNPATSYVIREWDRRGIHDMEICAQLAAIFRDEIGRRKGELQPSNRLAELVTI